MNGKPVNVDLLSVLVDYLDRRRTLGFGLVEEERHARRFLEWLWARGTLGRPSPLRRPSNGHEQAR